MKNKDVKALMAVTSKEELAEMERQAKEMNRGIDELLKEYLEMSASSVPETLPETRNEKIEADGRTATLEFKDAKSDTWKTARFIKEDDVWKVKGR
ncbi:MAG TPA: hypothetical protein VF791_20775 [Pyrinomonadaceae bacterium]